MYQRSRLQWSLITLPQLDISHLKMGGTACEFMFNVNLMRLELWLIINLTMGSVINLHM